MLKYPLTYIYFYMELFTLSAKVIVKVYGIAGNFEQVVEYHVQANNVQEAIHKYETKVKADFAHMGYESITFQYLKRISTIK